MTFLDPRDRFSSRVDDYVRWRPSYPPEVIALLRREAGLKEGSIVADIGSGTGIFTSLLLDAGAEVYAIEPNAPMREAAARALGMRERFHSVDATAERTSLRDASVDLIVAAQAFHWFDRNAARREFARILRPRGTCAILWNERRTEGDAFLEGYEALLLRHGTDYTSINHRQITDDVVAAFFAPGKLARHAFTYTQELEWEGLLGRCLSSSYVPARGTSEAESMMRDLRALFDATSTHGVVQMVYDTTVYLGPLPPRP